MRWSIDGNPIPGPDVVEYHSGETTTLLNGAPRKHMHRSIALSYRNLPASMLASLWQMIYDTARANRTVLLSYYDEDGIWRTSPSRPRIPTVGSFRGIEGVDIVLTFFLDPNIDADFVGFPPAPAPLIGEQSPPDPRRFLINQIPMVGALMALQAGTPSVSELLAFRNVVGVVLELQAGTPSVSDDTGVLSISGVVITVESGTADVGDFAIRPNNALLALLVASPVVENQPETVNPVGGSLALNAGTLLMEGSFIIAWGDIVVDLLAGTPEMSDE